MAIVCLRCNQGYNALPKKCIKCGNSDLTQFFRIDDEDINPELYEKDKEWLNEAGEEIEPKPQSILNWACPDCNHYNKWPFKSPKIGFDTWLDCQKCGKEFHMTYTPDGWKWGGDWRIG